MHPADQIEAFNILADMGEAVARIAARFGLSERLVEQRIRLGAVAPEIREDYRAGNLTMRDLEVFASTTDQDRGGVGAAEADQPTGRRDPLHGAPVP